MEQYYRYAYNKQIKRPLALQKAKRALSRVTIHSKGFRSAIAAVLLYMSTLVSDIDAVDDWHLDHADLAAAALRVRRGGEPETIVSAKP